MNVPASSEDDPLVDLEFLSKEFDIGDEIPAGNERKEDGEVVCELEVDKGAARFSFGKKDDETDVVLSLSSAEGVDFPDPRWSTGNRKKKEGSVGRDELSIGRKGKTDSRWKLTEDDPVDLRIKVGSITGGSSSSRSTW